MKVRWLHSLLAGCLALLVATPALADSPIDKASALEADFDSLIESAQRAFTEQDFEAAIEYLVISNRLEPDPRLFLNIARSYEEMGECHLSVVYYEAFLNTELEDSALIERAQTAIEEQAPGCAAYHEGLSGRVRIDSAPILARVYLEDEFVGLAPTETAALEPGTYTFRFEKEGYADQIEEVEIWPDDEVTVRARLREAVNEPEEPDEEPEPVDEPPVVDEDDEFSLNPVAVGIAGAGVGGLLIGAIFDLAVIPGVDEEWQQVRDGEADPPEGQQPLEYLEELEDKRNGYVTMAVISYVTGAVLLVGGAGWITYDYLTAGADDEPSYSWQLEPRLGTDGAGLRLLRRF